MIEMQSRMSRAALSALAGLLLAMLAAGSASAQTTEPAPSGPQLTREQVTVYAKTYIAVSKVRDAIHLELAQARNKTPEAQKALQERLREQIAQAVKENGLSEEAYRRLTYVISSDPVQRKLFDEIVAELTKKT